MSRLILAFASSAALAIAALVVHQPAAQAATPTATPGASTAQSAADPATGRTGHRKGRGERLKNNPAFQAIRNLRQLERLYLIDGRAQEIPALYRDVLARTENPAVRQFAYNRIARNELKPGDVDKAIATLRQGLEESLQRLPAQ